jgi:hypothetical protein
MFLPFARICVSISSGFRPPRLLDITTLFKEHFTPLWLSRKPPT